MPSAKMNSKFLLENNAVFSPDGTKVLTGSIDGTIRFYEVSTGEELRRFSVNDHVWSVAFSPDGRQFLSGTEHGAMMLWDIETGELLRTFEGYMAKRLFTVAFSPDGKRVLSAGEDGVARLWDISDLAPALTTRATEWVFHR